MNVPSGLTTMSSEASRAMYVARITVRPSACPVIAPASTVAICGWLDVHLASVVTSRSDPSVEASDGLHLRHSTRAYGGRRALNDEANGMAVGVVGTDLSPPHATAKNRDDSEAARFMGVLSGPATAR